MTLLSLVTEKQMNSEDNLYTFTPSCPSSTLYPCLWVLPFLLSLETVCPVEKLPPFSSMLSNFPSAFCILQQTPMSFPSLLQNPKLTLHAPPATAPFFCFHLQKNSSKEFWYSPWLNALPEVSPGPSPVMLLPPHPTNMSLWRLKWLACAESNDQFPRANSSFGHSWFPFPLWCSFFIWLSTFSWFPSYLIDDSCSASFSGFLSSPCLLKLEGYRAPFLVSSYLFSGLREKWQIDDRYIHTFIPTEINTQIYRYIDRLMLDDLNQIYGFTDHMLMTPKYAS